jgi:hypothetical protein
LEAPNAGRLSDIVLVVVVASEVLAGAIGTLLAQPAELEASDPPAPNRLPMIVIRTILNRTTSSG